MQKELKIGLAIGAVLLVVLIVYLAVPNTNTDVAQDAGDGSDTPTDVQESNESAAGETDVATTEEPASPAETPVAGNEVFAPDATAPAEPTGADASAGTDWANLLNNGAPITTETPALPQLQARTTIGGTRAATPSTPAIPAEQPETPTAAPAEASDSALVDPAGRLTGGTLAEPSGTAKPEPSEPEAAAGPTNTVGTASASASAGTRTHTIRPGESFSRIAKVVYNDERQYLAIQKANPDVDPAKLKPGQVIRLPDLDAATVASAKISGSTDAPAATPSAPAAETKLDPNTQYKVKSGDSLYKIAQSVYGSSNMIDDIYEANKTTIGPDSAKLKVGMVLKMPPNPNAQASSR